MLEHMCFRINGPTPTPRQNAPNAGVDETAIQSCNTGDSRIQRLFGPRGTRWPKVRVCVLVRMRVRVHMYMYVYVCVCVYVYLHVKMNVYVFEWRGCVCAHGHERIHARVFAHEPGRACVSMHIHVRVHACGRCRVRVHVHAHNITRRIDGGIRND